MCFESFEDTEQDLLKIIHTMDDINPITNNFTTECFSCHKEKPLKQFVSVDSMTGKYTVAILCSSCRSQKQCCL